MSFLPYARPPAAVWAASVGGSSLVHGGLAVLLLTSSVAFLPVPTVAPSRTPDFEVTLEILDADIIETIEPEPDAPVVPPDAVPLTPDTTTAEQVQETPDTLLTPDDAGEDLLAPSDSILPAPPEDITALQPEPQIAQPNAQAPVPFIAPVEPDPQEDVVTIDDISPIDSGEISPLAQTVAPATPAPADVVTVLPETAPDDSAAALILPEVPQTPAAIPTLVLPDAAAEGPQAETLAPSIIAPDDIEPEVIAPEPEALNPEPQPAPLAPNVPDAPQAIANPDPVNLAIGTLLRRIRATPSPVCTLALPRRAGPDGVGVSFIGSQTQTLDTFAAQILRDLSPTPVQTREIIDPRQCALLDVVRQIADYPAGRIGLTLEDTTLQSGENLRGRVVGAGGLFITLLLIDDNGVVQDMARFTTIEGNDPVFDAPVARSGPARATRQVLLALASADGPIDVSAQIGQNAETMFSVLPAELLDQIVFGLATFDVR